MIQPVARVSLCLLLLASFLPAQLQVEQVDADLAFWAYQMRYRLAPNSPEAQVAGRAIDDAVDGGWFVLGGSVQDPVQGVIVTRFGIDGELLWARVYGPADDSFVPMGSEIFAMPDGGAVVTSSTWAFRIDSAGVPLWDAQYPGTLDFIMSRARDALYAADDDHVVRVDPADGSLVWSKFFDDGSSLDPQLSHDAGDGVLLVGNRFKNATLIDGDGNVIWTRRYMRPVAATFITYRVVASAQGGWYVFGSYQNPTLLRAQVTRLDEDGVARWSRRIKAPDGWLIIPRYATEFVDGGVIFTTTLNDQALVAAFRRDGRQRFARYYFRTGGLCFILQRDFAIEAIAVAPEGDWCMTGNDNGLASVTETSCSLTTDQHVIRPFPDGRMSFTGRSRKIAAAEAPITVLERSLNSVLESPASLFDDPIVPFVVRGVRAEERVPFVIDEAGP